MRALGAGTGYLLRDSLVQSIVLLLISGAVGAGIGVAAGAAISSTPMPFDLQAGPIALASTALLVLADLVDREHAGRADLRDRPRLAHELPRQPPVASRLQRQPLQRDLALQRAVESAMDDRDLVPRELVTDLEALRHLDSPDVHPQSRQGENNRGACESDHRGSSSGLWVFVSCIIGQGKA